MRIYTYIYIYMCIRGPMWLMMAYITVGKSEYM